MLTLSLLALTASVLVVAVIVCGALLRVALAGPEGAQLHNASRRAWRPPPIRDHELQAWAEAAARREVLERVAHFRGANLALEISRGMQAGVRRAIGGSPYNPAPRAEHACSSCRHHWLGVTPPEVLSITETLRQQSGHVRRQITRRARENSERARSLSCAEFEAAGVVCPLFLDGHVCAANGCRPLQCCGWVRVAGQAVSERPEGLVDASLDVHALAVSRGMQSGLAEALRQRGLDGECYEFNSALLVALEVPNAAGRWSRGEALFADCPRCDE